MEQIELEVTPREVMGKKVKFLRRQGVTPLHLFGHSIEPLALQCDTTKLRRVLAQAGKTRLVNLKLGSEDNPRMAVVREVQRDALTGETLHADFYQVEMAESIKVAVPIAYTGEAPALRSKENMLVHELSTLTVQCLPGQIPDKIELDLTSLTEAEQAVRVSDLKLGKGITVLDDPERVLVRITLRPVEEKVEKPVVAEEVAKAPEAAAPAEEETKEE